MKGSAVRTAVFSAVVLMLTAWMPRLPGMLDDRRLLGVPQIEPAPASVWHTDTGFSTTRRIELISRARQGRNDFVVIERSDRSLEKTGEVQWIRDCLDGLRRAGLLETAADMRRADMNIRTYIDLQTGRSVTLCSCLLAGAGGELITMTVDVDTGLVCELYVEYGQDGGTLQTAGELADRWAGYLRVTLIPEGALYRVGDADAWYDLACDGWSQRIWISRSVRVQTAVADALP